MFDRENLLVWTACLCFAVWGGIVGYYRKVKQGMLHTWWKFLGEVSTSALAGVAVGILALDVGVSTVQALLMTSVAGHMGGKVFDIAENVVKNFLEGLGNR